MDRNIVRNSAAGTASQIPFTPMNFGRSKIFATIIPNVRTKEMIAEIFPLENAVNIEEAKILIPAKI